MVITVVLFLLSTAAWAKMTVNYSGSDGTVQINTQTPGFNDDFSMNAGGEFSGYHYVEEYDLSREAQFSGSGSIYAATYPTGIDGLIGITIQGSTGYLGQNFNAVPLATDFLAEASGCTYLIDAFIGGSYIGLGAILEGNGNGEIDGDFSVNAGLISDVYALGDGSGTFGLYAFAPYLNFGANIWIDSLYVDAYLCGYDAWIDMYSTFDSYLEGYGYVEEY